MMWREMGPELVIDQMWGFKTKADPELVPPQFSHPGSLLASPQPQLCLRLAVPENAMPFLRRESPEDLAWGRNLISWVGCACHFLWLLDTEEDPFFHVCFPISNLWDHASCKQLHCVKLTFLPICICSVFLPPVGPEFLSKAAARQEDLRRNSICWQWWRTFPEGTPAFTK